MDTGVVWIGEPVSDSDEKLLEQLRHGDDAAFENLFLRHYDKVYRVVHKLVADQHEAEDLVQETFLALHQHPPRLPSGAPLVAWLCRVALNRGYNILRGRRRGEAQLPHLTPPDSVSEPDAEVLRREEQAGVRETLTRLPERQSQLLLLRHAGLSYGEIAAALGIAPGSVGTLLVRAERAFLQAHVRANPAHEG